MKKISLISTLLILWLIFGLIPAYADNDSSHKSGNEQEKSHTKKENNDNSSSNSHRALLRGFSGDDVKTLQEWLARDKDVYPEGIVSGYYGHLTEKAVKKFQKKYGIEQVGIFGPKTRAQLERLFGTLENRLENAGIDPTPLSDTFNRLLSSSSLATTTVLWQWHKLTLCHNGAAISVDLHAIAAHLKHGDTVGFCGGTSVSTDKTAPIIYGISASAGVNTTSVSWYTNESSDSRVWYATSTPVLSAPDAAHASSASLLTSHSIDLVGLSTSTMYHYLVVSRDASGNTATSTEGLFTTSAAPAADNTAPFIYGVSASAGVNTASVSWYTNEPANATAWYATALDVMTSPSRAFVANSSLGTSRTLDLTGLSASTQYYFLAVSADASGNTATSTSNLYTFVTSPLAISALSATPTSTAATVSWQTNVTADSTVHYATSTPVLFAPNHATASNASLVTSHSLDLSVLATNTTYYYVVVSTDAASNTATSSESSFATTSD